MDSQTQAQIYLADQRGWSQTSWFRSGHTFNFGHYTAESREPFGPLRLLNEDTLRAGASLTLQVEAPAKVVLIPVVGGLEYNVPAVTSEPATGFLEPGEAGVLTLTTGMTYVVSNPYELEYINFIQLWLDDGTIDSLTTVNRHSFDLGTKNKLHLLFEFADAETGMTAVGKGFIGQYEGRQDAAYSVNKPETDIKSRGIFVFVLKGAFEVANRLMHEKDGLSLHYETADELEFEALSNDAILILLDFPVTS